MPHPRPMSRRPTLASLGRHLLRSVLRVCITAQELQAALPGLPRNASAARQRERAEELVAEGGPHAQALHERLDALHAQALRRCSALSDARQLQALWCQALQGHEPLPGLYWALLTHPAADRALRHLAYGDVDMLLPPDAPETPWAMLVARRSVSPRRLGLPAPSAEALEQIIQAALSAPDHGRLMPWRVLEFRSGQRAALAELFAAEKLRRDPLASDKDVVRARAHAEHPPCLLAFVVSPKPRKRIPAREQWLAAGAALGNLLNAAHALGYGAIMLSGERCFDDTLAAELGLAPGERLAGFLSLGTAIEPAPATARPLAQQVWSCWTPGTTAVVRGPNPFARLPGRFSDEEVE